MSEIVEQTPAQILRAWGEAYRQEPDYRFPSDPDAEFFPVDMDRAADELERLAALVERANKRFAEILDCVDDEKQSARLEIEKIATRAMLECQGYPLTSDDRA